MTNLNSAAEQVREFTQGSPLSIASVLNKYAYSESVGELPRHRDFHWRGLWQPSRGLVHGVFRAWDELLPAVPPESRVMEFEPYATAILCHNKPINDLSEPRGSEARYPDIPDRLDIYLLLRHQFDAIAFAGRKVAAIIRRTEATYPTILRLRDWEQDRERGRYRRSRGRSQLCHALGREPFPAELERQHATSALRALGLVWHRKPKERETGWMESLAAIGLTVELSHELSPLRYRATTTYMYYKLEAKRRQYF